MKGGSTFYRADFVCVCFQQEGLANFLFNQELSKSCAERKTVQCYGWAAVTAWCKLSFRPERRPEESQCFYIFIFVGPAQDISAENVFLTKNSGTVCLQTHIHQQFNVSLGC